MVDVVDVVTRRDGPVGLLPHDAGAVAKLTVGTLDLNPTLVLQNSRIANRLGAWRRLAPSEGTQVEAVDVAFVAFAIGPTPLGAVGDAE